MEYQFYQPHLRFDKPVSIMLLVGIALVISGWFFFERNACELVSFVHNTGRLLSVQPDLTCRMLSLTY